MFSLLLSILITFLILYSQSLTIIFIPLVSLWPLLLANSIIFNPQPSFSLSKFLFLLSLNSSISSMEISLSSSNHCTLTLTSRSPCGLRAIRTQFLGCSHNLRPPGGIRSTRNNKCKKKLQLLHLHYSPRFAFKASLGSHSIIVIVTLFTLSAVSLFYYRRRKKSSKQVINRLLNNCNL